jgi:putative ABC transport system permease protein
MPRWVEQLRVALRSIFRRGRAERELEEELRYHLELEVQAQQGAGLTAEEARAAALRAMGAIEARKDECRDLRRGRVVSEFLSDLRYAARALRRRPGIALLAIMIMAVGIGANTAVFSVVNGVLLRSLPYPDADRIVVLRTTAVTTGQINPLVTLANFWDWRAQSSSFDAMATFRGGEAPVTPGDTAEFARHANVDVQLFRVFGVEPIVGRAFTAEEGTSGNDRPVALISHAYWQSRYNGDAAILQRTIRVGTGLRSIVGVMPPGFHFPNRTDVWTPQTNRTASRTSHSFLAVARLNPRVSLQAAQTELNAIAARLAEQYPDSNEGRGVSAARLQDQLVGDVRLTLYLMWGAVVVVLLIACANTATLLLGKATARAREIAVRTTLGASRGRIIRQLVTESLLLALVAGASGVALANWGMLALIALTPADVVRLTDTGMRADVLGFTLVLSMLTSVLFGLVPALQASKVDLVDAVRNGGASAVVGRRTTRTRAALVVTEIALAVVLLAGAGLLVKSLVMLQRVDLGFQPANVLVMKATGVRSLSENNAFFGRLLPRLAALPGVLAAGATSIPPGDLALSGDGAYHIDRVPEVRDRNLDPQALFTIVTPGAFAALGIPITRGRDFDEGDTEDRPLVAIVNEALVRKSLGDQDPIGRTIFCSWDRKGGMTIVGVVGDARQRDPGLDPMPDCYMPYRQHAYNSNTLNVVARTAGDPMALADTVRRAAAEIAPDVPVAFTTMDATLAKRMEEPTFRAILFVVFAGVAVTLAMAGVYGVVADAVQQRSREIGLRIALGASRDMVRRMILGQCLLLAGIGSVLGLVGAAVATRFLETVLFEVKPLDVATYLGVAALLTIVTLAASYLPARRAAGLDPMQVLKSD